MSSLNQKAVDRILHPIMGGKVAVRDIMELEGGRTYIDFGDDDLITKRALYGFNPSATVIDALVTTTDPDIYTFSPTELVILNTYTRYPNFVAIVMATGQQFFDIYPIYTGSVGAFTACVVQLHSDGAGNNAEDTTIQFS
jgi:hypothetical protein